MGNKSKNYLWEKISLIFIKILVILLKISKTKMKFLDISTDNLDQSDLVNNQFNFQNNVHENTLALFEHQNTKKTSKGKEPMKYL